MSYWELWACKNQEEVDKLLNDIRPEGYELMDKPVDTSKLTGRKDDKDKPGALRFNDGKTPYGNLPFDLLDGAAKVMAYGANKYGDSENFRKGYNDLLSPLHSLFRHSAELQRAIQTMDVDNANGFLLDSESKEAHIHHVVTSALMLIHSMRLKGFKI